jgi:excisionase family DNA binding protein
LSNTEHFASNFLGCLSKKNILQLNMPYYHTMLSTKGAAKHLGVHEQTIRRWEREGKITAHRLGSGQRRFTLRDLEVAEAGHKPELRATVIYCRVAKCAKDDLAKQIQYMQSIYPDAEIISDVSSGVSHDRPGLQSLLERIMRGMVATVAVSDESKIGSEIFKFFESVARFNGTKVVVTHNQSTCSQREFAEDIVTIIGKYTTYLPKLRRFKPKVKELLDQSESQKESGAEVGDPLDQSESASEKDNQEVVRSI